MLACNIQMIRWLVSAFKPKPKVSLSITENDNLPSCSICAHNYDTSTRRPMVLHCGHSFCADCTTQLLRTQLQPACPQCRIPFKNVDVKINYELSNNLETMIRMMETLNARGAAGGADRKSEPAISVETRMSAQVSSNDQKQQLRATPPAPLLNQSTNSQNSYQKQQPQATMPSAPPLDRSTNTQIHYSKFVNRHIPPLQRSENAARVPQGRFVVCGRDSDSEYGPTNHRSARNTRGNTSHRVTPTPRPSHIPNKPTTPVPRRESATVSHGTNLRIDNLDLSFNDADLRRVFENFGKLITATVVKNNGEATGHVCFASEANADLAIAVLDKSRVGNNYIYITKKT